MKKNIKIISLLLVIIFMCYTVTACKSNNLKTIDNKNNNDSKDVVMVTDIMGNEVEIKRPVKSVYYPYYYEMLLTIVGPDAFTKVSCTSVYDTKEYSKTIYEVFEENVEGFKDMVDIGSTFTDNFSIEKLLEIKPDVAIFAAYQLEGITEENLETIKKAGIPIVIIDFSDMSIEGHIESARIIGQIFGVEDRVRELADNYIAQIEDVRDRVKDIKYDERRSILLEQLHSINKYEEYGESYGKNGMMGILAEYAKADNIYADIYDRSGEINPEYLFEKNPDVILLDSGNYFDESKETVNIGLTIDEETVQRTGKKLVDSRKGWDNLKAVQNNEVYIVDNDLMRTLRDYTIVQFIGKILYPELFEDVDPAQNNKEFLEKYLPSIPSDSVYMTRIKIF